MVAAAVVVVPGTEVVVDVGAVVVVGDVVVGGWVVVVAGDVVVVAGCVVVVVVAGAAGSPSERVCWHRRVRPSGMCRAMGSSRCCRSGRSGSSSFRALMRCGR